MPEGIQAFFINVYKTSICMIIQTQTAQGEIIPNTPFSLTVAKDNKMRHN